MTNEEPSSTVTDERAAVEQVRAGVADLIHPRYNTYYNILRWLQSHEFNVSKTIHLLRKHLKWRKERHLDEDESSLQRCPITEEFAPWTILGRQHEGGDRLIIVEQAGKIDIGGVMKAVQPTQYLHQHYRYVESIFRRLNEMEAEVGHQSSTYYIFDLEGLQFDPSLLGIVAGPFRVSWQELGNHYRNWIDKFIIVNAPGFLNILYSAISPFIPNDFRERIVFTGKDFKEELRELCDPAFLPQKYGGDLDDSVLRPSQPVPKEKYWKPREDYPPVKSLHSFNVPASKSRSLRYKITEPVDVFLYMMSEKEISFGIYYAPNEEAEAEVEFPEVCRSGVPAMDMFDYRMEPGLYEFRFSNNAAWLFSAPIKFLLLDKQGKEVRAENQKDKWIKH